MKLSEFIAAYGDERVQFQNLDKCAITIDYHHKKGTTIAFGTDMQIGPNGMEKLGLVMWFDREDAAKIIENYKEKS
jgi:hypothetical protein